MGTFFSDLFAKIASGIDKLLDSAGQLISSLGGQLVSVFGSILDTVTGIGIYPITSTVGLILNFIIDSIAGLLTILCNSGLQMFNNVDLEYGTGSSIYEIIFINGMSSIFDVLPIFAYGLLGLFFMAHMAMIFLPQGSGHDSMSTIVTILSSHSARSVWIEAFVL